MRTTRSLTAALAVAGLAAGLAALPATAAHAAPACHVRFTLQDQGFGNSSATVAIRNLGDPVNGWAVQFAFPTPTPTITGPTFGATWTQAGQQVTGTNLPGNAALAPGQATAAGFRMIGRPWPPPDSYTLNGTLCTHEVVIGPVYDPPPPIVALTSPSSFTTYIAPATVPITAYALATGSSVNRVEFFAGAELLATDTTAPYEFQWQVMPGQPGTSVTHSLTARMVDNRGASATSSPRIVTVVTPG
jgi:hypothetical protein